MGLPRLVSGTSFGDTARACHARAFVLGLREQCLCKRRERDMSVVVPLAWSVKIKPHYIAKSLRAEARPRAERRYCGHYLMKKWRPFFSPCRDGSRKYRNRHVRGALPVPENTENGTSALPFRVAGSFLGS